MRFLNRFSMMTSYTVMYVLALSIIALMVMSSYYIMNSIVSQQVYDAKVINISGRQRMLSQRIALLAIHVTLPDKREQAKAALIEATDEMLSNHMLLSGQKMEQDIIGSISASTYSLYFDKKIEINSHGYTQQTSLNDLVMHYIKDAQRILSLKDSELHTDNPYIRHLAYDYHDLLLPVLNNVVLQYQAEGEQKVQKLKNAKQAFMLITLALLILESVFIFQPMVSDIQKRNSQLKLANHTLRQQQNREKLAALGELSGGLAHEINNALVPSIGMSEILHKRLKNTHPDLVEFVDIIHESSMHARKIVQNVLAFARGQDAQNEISQIGELFTHAIDINRPIVSENISLHVGDISKIENQHIYVNKTAITQVIANLMKNAAEAMPDGGNISISFETRAIDTDFAIDNNLVECDHLVVEINDDGPGMHEHVLKQIFNPFFTTKEVGEGTGLGLSTVYGIMQNLGGAVTVDSQVGKGSTFCLFFPLTNPKIFKPVTSEVKAA